MSYATQQHLIDRFGLAELLKIANRDADEADALDPTVMAAALADADAEIDSYIGKAYALPLTTVPARIVDLAKDIALYKLYPSNPPEDVRNRYKDAIAFLVSVAKGLAVLPIESGAAPAAASAGVRLVAPDRAFSRDSMKGF